MTIEKYSTLWILHLASSTGGIRVNPLKYRKPKWWNKMWHMSEKGLLKKTRYSCADFKFEITEKGKLKFKGLEL